MDFLRAGEIIATLRISAISTQRASCDRPEGSAEILVGDRVRLSSGAPAGTVDDERPPATLTSSTAAAPPSRPFSVGGWLRDHGYRGRVGLRYLGVTDHDGFGSSYRQPALDVRLDGSPQGAAGLRFSVDARSRRTFRTGGSDAPAEGRTRVYRLLGEWRVSPRLRAAAGRQYATGLTAVGIFDGVSVDYDATRWSFGAFSGVLPDASTFGLSSDVHEHGIHVGWRERATGRSRWQVTVGAIGSYENGEINRENLSLQARYAGDRLFASAIQEVDINRGWKREAGEPALSATSALVSVRYRIRSHASVNAGFDNRRVVRLYRDRITPETEFDDSARQGYWGGLEYRPTAGLRLGLRARETTGGSSGVANSVTATVRASWPAVTGLSAGVRSTTYRNTAGSGRLHSVSAGATLGRTHVDLSGGLRRETPDGPLAADNLHWWGIDADRRLSNAWLLLLSFEASRGGLERSDQLYANAIYRF
ncbi:MAG: hypothetical protein HKN12_05880 [Gemmatimonadetes bacterium]|nr:hypothetical protein [Gemmatimonadota bacterium]